MRKILLLFLLFFSSLEAGIYRDERDFREDLIRAPPPPERYEIPPPPPGIIYVWIPGHWGWKNGYYWIPGNWAKPPSPYSRWLQGHWESTTGGFIYVPGRWT